MISRSAAAAWLPRVAAGRCARDGLWLERGTRADFEAVFSAEIATHNALPQSPEQQRIAELERRVADLEQIVSRISGQVFWRRWKPD